VLHPIQVQVLMLFALFLYYIMINIYCFIFNFYILVLCTSCLYNVIFFVLFKLKFDLSYSARVLVIFLYLFTL